MTMSSLQQHASLLVAPPPQPSKPTPCTNNDASSATKKNNAKYSFESCFSAGLDLSEFATTNTNSSNNNSNNIIVAASAGLAQLKRNAVEQQTREEKAEIVLEQRVANVIDATTKQHNSATTNNSIHDQLGNVIPRAINPHNEKSPNVDNSWDHMNSSSSIDDEIIKGRSRDDNFVQFQDSHGAGNEFLSCLVSNHKVEGEEGRIGSSHRARMTKKKQQQQLLQKKKMSPGSTGRQHHTTIASKKMSSASGGSGRKVFAKKKSRKSKY